MTTSDQQTLSGSYYTQTHYPAQLATIYHLDTGRPPRGGQEERLLLGLLWLLNNMSSSV